ncbi:MAG: hypothetical protein KAG66_00295 [Methylococcales bacterium]|nr:hypothetical protein [Methylococcales bacterium]
MIALLGVVINSVYAIDLLQTLFNPHHSSTIRDISISAIALEFGWAALLFWAAFKPIERRHLLLFTAIPIFLANFLHSMNQLIYEHSDASMIVLNLLIGFVFAGLFVYAFLLGSACEQ